LIAFLIFDPSTYFCTYSHINTMDQDPGFIAAVEEAKKGAAEGGVPIGAALVSKDGKILGRGHNMRAQNGSAILHVSSSSYMQGVK
jgi:tRNA(Arg) A34 adenosine deaminase TadA